MKRKIVLVRQTHKRVIVVLIIVFIFSVVARNLLGKAIKVDNKKSQVSVVAGNAISGESLSGITIKFIQGKDNPDGESIRQVITGVNGDTFIELPYGEYTVLWTADEYYACYQNVEVCAEEVLLTRWMIPIIEDNVAYILVEWEAEADLDLYVYNEQTKRCIGKETTLEDAGGFLYGDNDETKGYELVLLNDYNKNVYMIYVKNNEISIKNQRKSKEAISAIVSIYTSNGLLYQKEMNGKGRAMLWHYADINYGQVEEREENVYDLSGYAWATRDKNNPVLWTEGASVKKEEKYEYHESNGMLYNIQEDIFNLDGDHIACYSYRSDGSMSYGNECEYDENGNLLTSYMYDGRGMLFLKSEYVYDEYGKRIQACMYDIDGEKELLNVQTEYVYDQNGNLIACLDYDNEGMLICGEEYEYDRNGNKVSYFLYDRDKLYSRYETEYNDDGNEIVVCEYGEDGSLKSKTEYEYAPNGNYVSGCTYDEQGFLSSRLKCEYDENGNLVSDYSYDGDGRLTGKREYDTHGNQTAIYTYRDGVLTSQHINIFDENENPIEYYEYQDGKLKTKILREFNENGECICCYVYNGDGSLRENITYDYICEYDAVGGMKIFYYYVNDVLTTKKITLFY